MHRDYSVRGKRITVDELEGILAVRLESPKIVQQVQQGLLTVEWYGKALALTQEPEMPLAVRALLERGNWILMRPADSPAVSGKTIKPVVVGRVYRNPSGEFMINTGHMTVRLRESLQEPAAEDVLSRHGLTLTRRLRFAPNLFEVQADSADRAMSFASDATNDHDIVYAEPQMLRFLGGR